MLVPGPAGCCHSFRLPWVYMHPLSRRAGDDPRQGGHRLGPSRGVMADSEHPHTFTEGAMSDARAGDLARDIVWARSRSAEGSDLMAREYYTIKYATARSLQSLLRL